MGLLDDSFFNDPNGMAQAQMGLGLLAAASPRAASVAQAIQGAIGSRRQFDQDALRRRQVEAQIEEMASQSRQRQAQEAALRAKAEQDARLRTALPGLFRTDPGPALAQGGQVGDIGPTQSNAARLGPPQFDVMGAMRAGITDPDLITKYAGLSNLGRPEVARVEETTDGNGRPVKRQFDKFGQAVGGDLGQWKAPVSVDRGGSTDFVDPVTLSQRGSFPKTGNPFTDLVLGGPDGSMMPNRPLIDAKKSISKAGAANTSIRVENKMGESLAKEIGPIMQNSAEAANGAALQADAAQRIVQAVDSNKMFAGPTATLRLRGAQIAGMLGMGGKDDAEKIANTRQAIRGLAEMTLQGRKQMRGQGAITESESALAERAISGNIDDLTASEIKQLAQASDRSARFIHGQHEQRMNTVRGNPNTVNIAPFYEAAPMPEVKTSAPSSTFKILPPARDYAGRRMKADNGTVYRSDGTKWVKE